MGKNTRRLVAFAAADLAHRQAEGGRRLAERCDTFRGGA